MHSPEISNTATRTGVSTVDYATTDIDPLHVDRTTPTAEFGSVNPNDRERTSVSAHPPSSTRSASISSRRESADTHRRLGRKLPPALTESLLELEEQHLDRRASMRSDSTIRPSSTDQSRGSSASACTSSSSGGPGPGSGSRSSQSQSKYALYPGLSFDRDTVMSSPVFKHDFAKYTLTVDRPLEERFAWARQASPSPSPSPSPQPRSPVSPWSPPISTVGSTSASTSTHGHRRSTSLTPSDTPSVTFADTPTSPVSPGVRARAQVHSHWRTKLRHVSSTSRDESSASGSGSSSCGMQTGGEPSLTTCSTASTSCWSNFDELETRSRWQKGAKETRRERKDRKRWEAEAFSADRPPSLKDLFEAGMCEVMDENGQRTPFRSVVSERRTIVIFIRHWYCPLCAQYLNSIIANVKPRVLEQAEVDLVVIGNGSYRMLDGYKNKHFKFPFKMYTDPTLALYRALGLTRQTGDAGQDADAGSYLIQTPLESTVQTIKRATKMPLRAPGHFLQLGGEFVFEGSLNVSYTHRMSTTRDHSPIEEVCEAAGVQLEYIHYEPGPRPPPVHRASLDGGEDDRAWMVEREEALAEMQRKKIARRWKGVVTDAGDAGDDDGVMIVGEGSDEDLGDLAERMDRFGRLPALAR